MTGIEVLGEVRRRSPETKVLLLTAYADTDVAIKAINDIGLDSYMLKPWDPPEERLYPVIDDLLGDWQGQHPDRSAEVRVVGHRWSDRSVETPRLAARPRVFHAGVQRAGGVRRRRRTPGLDEAGRLGRRRGRDVGLSRAPLPGHDLMTSR